jgi:hypothetical protein
MVARLIQTFFISFIACIFGMVIALIVWGLIHEIGWHNKEEILIGGYGLLASITYFFVTYLNQMKREELENLRKEIDLKADRSEVVNLHFRLDDVKKSIDNIDAKLTTLTDHLIKKNLEL